VFIEAAFQAQDCEEKQMSQSQEHPVQIDPGVLSSNYLTTPSCATWKSRSKKLQ